MADRLTGGVRPQVKRACARAFGAARQARFLAELAATCNVALSARRAKVAASTVRRHRASDAGFRAGWAAAIQAAYQNLELMMLDRAMNGTVKTVTKPDGSVDRTHEYPNAIALALLRLHRDEAAPDAAGPEPDEDIEEVRARILRRIQRLRG